jgi:nucleoside-diphosphate kinase
MPNKHERTLILVKPDGIQRALIGEIISRFERKGLKLIGLKMIILGDADIEKHYGKYSDKPFFQIIKDYMTSGPVVAMVWEGLQAVKSCRLVCGEKRHGFESEAGSIRGDFALSGGNNLVHSSDSVENATEEISKFFSTNELLDYSKSDYKHVYSPEDL